jgi:hypothetical protein
MSSLSFSTSSHETLKIPNISRESLAMRSSFEIIKIAGGNDIETLHTIAGLLEELGCTTKLDYSKALIRCCYNPSEESRGESSNFKIKLWSTTNAEYASAMGTNFPVSSIDSPASSIDLPASSIDLPVPFSDLPGPFSDLPATGIYSLRMSPTHTDDNIFVIEFCCTERSGTIARSIAFSTMRRIRAVIINRNTVSAAITKFRLLKLPLPLCLSSDPLSLESSKPPL